MKELTMEEMREFSKKYVLETGDETIYYVLPNLLPESHVLVFHTRLCLLSHLAPACEIAGRWPRLLAQEQFTQSEGKTLLPLLENFPHFCPYEVLWANFNAGQITDESVARARSRLQEAQFAGVWEYEMRPVRNVLSRMRLKLRAFGIDARSILETGYLLRPFTKKEEA